LDPIADNAEVCQQAVGPALRNMLIAKDDVPLKVSLVATEGPGSQSCSCPPLPSGQGSCSAPQLVRNLFNCLTRLRDKLTAKAPKKSGALSESTGVL